MQQQKTFLQHKIPREVEKEMLILHDLGLEDYEIDYLLFLKMKKQASIRWDT